MSSRTEVGVEQEGGKEEVAAAEGVGRAGGAAPIYRISSVDAGSPSSSSRKIAPSSFSSFLLLLLLSSLLLLLPISSISLLVQAGRLVL